MSFCQLKFRFPFPKIEFYIWTDCFIIKLQYLKILYRWAYYTGEIREFKCGLKKFFGKLENSIEKSETKTAEKQVMERQKTKISIGKENMHLK